MDPPAPEVTLDVRVPNHVKNLVKHIMQVIQQLVKMFIKFISVKIKKMNGQHGYVLFQKSQTHQPYCLDFEVSYTRSMNLLNKNNFRCYI